MLSKWHPSQISAQTLIDQFEGLIYVDPKLQRRVVWRPTDSVDFIHSCATGFALNAIFIADIQSCLMFAKDEGIKADVRYFQDLLNRGYRYISLDGQNRTRALYSLFNDLLTIYSPRGDAPYVGVDNKTYNIRPAAGKLFTQLEPELQWALKMMQLSLVTVQGMSMSGLRKVFLKLNSGVPLNRMEKRNALNSEISDCIRSWSKNVCPNMWLHVGGLKEKIARMEDLKVLAECYIATHPDTLRKGCSDDDLDTLYSRGVDPHGERWDSVYPRSNLLRFEAILGMVSECIINRPTRNRRVSLQQLRALFAACEHLYDTSMDFADAGKFYEFIYNSDRELINASKGLEVEQNKINKSQGKEDAPSSVFYWHWCGVYKPLAIRTFREKALIHGGEIQSGKPLDPSLLPYTLKYAIDNRLVVDKDRNNIIIYPDEAEVAA